jgi:hypothetical protein
MMLPLNCHNRQLVLCSDSSVRYIALHYLFVRALLKVERVLALRVVTGSSLRV